MFDVTPEAPFPPAAIGMAFRDVWSPFEPAWILKEEASAPRQGGALARERLAAGAEGNGAGKHGKRRGVPPNV